MKQICLPAAALLILLMPLAMRPVQAQVVEDRLSQNSQVHITVDGEPNVTGDYTLDPRGNINMMYLGPVHLAGLTVPQAQAKVTQSLKKYFVNPQVMVNLLSAGVYRITGAVRIPAEYPLTMPNFTLADAIGRAGGIVDRAHMKECTIIRHAPNGRSIVMKIDARDAGVQGNTILQRGDDINIPQGRPGYSPNPIEALGTILGLGGLFRH